MKAVMLDADTLGSDIDLSPIRDAVDTLEVHGRSTTQQARERLAGAQAAIVNKVVLDGTTLEQLPDLKLIALLATGTDNIDMKAAARLGVTVRNITGYGTASVAQHTLMLMLALANRLPLYQQDLRHGHWQAGSLFCLLAHPMLQLQGKTLVIVGQGEIGSQVGRLAEAFGMQVRFAARPGGESNDKRPAFVELAPSADIISLHCPLNEATHHLVGTRQLTRLKPGALLVNCARGGIVDETAALRSLEDGQLGGLALDVLPEEPPRSGHPVLDALDRRLNLIVTPHIAWTSPEARRQVVELTARNLRNP